MERLHFSLFSDPITNRVNSLLTEGAIVLRVNVSKELLWQTYLNAYPSEVNQIFRERQHYDGQADRQFIVRMGALIVLDPVSLTLSTIWDVDVPGYFKQVAETMDQYIKSLPIEGFHLIAEPSSGSKPNIDNLNTDITWHHFFTNTPEVIKSCTPTSDKAELQARVKAYATLAEEFTVETLEQVLGLCDNIYRGSEFKTSVANAITFLKEYENKEYNPLYLYVLAKQTSKYTYKFRNEVIGTLAQDLQAGKDLNSAVASFEAKVAPANYRRTQSVVTPQMISIAEKEIENKGILHELYREPATITDIPVDDLLYTFTNSKVDTLFSTLKEEASSKVTKVPNTTEISYKDFITLIEDSKVNSLELLVLSNLSNSAMTLFKGTTPFNKDTNIFKWSNPISWMYKGGVSDSIQERVKASGGKIEADFRASLAWNSGSDYDLSVQSPYGVCNFSNRQKGKLTLDVDANGGYITNSTDPVENIFGDNIQDGTYKVIVDMFNLRSVEDRHQPFQLQIKVKDTIINYNANKMISKNGSSRHLPLLDIHIVNGEINKIINNFPEDLFESEISSAVIHNLNTSHFYPVKAITKSPNYWESGDQKGNEHIFFFLENMKLEDELNTFLPEYLNSSLQPIRKALELISSKLKVKLDVDTPQTTGFGFSTTMNKSVVVRVTINNQPRLYTVKFGV